MQPDQRDDRVEDKERSGDIPADRASEATRERVQNRTSDRQRSPDDFDPTSSGDESGEVR